MRFERSGINKPGSGVLSEYYILPALDLRYQILTNLVP